MEGTRIRGLTLFFLLLPAIALALSPAGGDWQPAMDRDGIQVYTRAVSGSPIAESLSVVTITARLEAVAALVLAADQYHLWIDSIDESRVLEQISPRESYNYTLSKAPWPISDRDAVVRARAQQDSITGVVTLASQGVPDLIPEKKGLVRVRKVDSTWTLTPLSPDRVEVRYRVHSDPGGALPGWLINTVVTDQPFNTLRNLRRELQRSEPLPALPAFIQAPGKAETGNRP